MNHKDSLDYLINLASQLGIYDLCAVVLEDKRFLLWSGSSKPFQHHYGDHGLVIHTAEVVKLCLANNDLLSAGIDQRKLYCAALFHDAGKMWDYAKILCPKEILEWGGTLHKREIHHISRSALVWQSACENYARVQLSFRSFGPTPSPPQHWLGIENPSPNGVDDVLHAILSHHGIREWGSPVSPHTKLAWMLHLCDGISARMNDCDKWDQVHKKQI